MKCKEIQDKPLKEILQALMEESALLCPVHQHRIEFLKERRGNSTQKEAEALRKAFQIFQTSSDTEEESPKKFSARQAKLGDIAGRQLFKELNEMSMGTRPCVKKVLDEEVLRAYKAVGDNEKIDDSEQWGKPIPSIKEVNLVLSLWCGSRAVVRALFQKKQ